MFLLTKPLPKPKAATNVTSFIDFPSIHGSQNLFQKGSKIAFQIALQRGIVAKKFSDAYWIESSAFKTANMSTSMEGIAKIKFYDGGYC